MHTGSTQFTAAVARTRRAAVASSQLDWSDRVLLAADEAACACLGPVLGAEVACVIAAKAGDALHDLSTVRALRLAVVDALASAGLASRVSSSATTRIVWRLVFDLWGGPDR